MASKQIYLDHAAATPLDPSVLAAMQPYWQTEFYNPSATYLPAVQVRQALHTARSNVAQLLGARPAEIIFTAGGTEANNLAIHGVMRQFPDANLAVSVVEHESVLKPAGRYDCRQVAVSTDGRLNLDDLRANIDDQTVLVSVMYANNEVGTVQPLNDVGRLVADLRRERLAKGNQLPLYLHSDACQAANYLDLHVARLGVDLLTLNGGKIYGPKQSGALYVRAGVKVLPLIDGGGQEQGLRSGTENVAAAAGFAAAMQLAHDQRGDESRRLAGLQQQFIKLLAEQLPDAVINGSLKHRLPNNIHLTLPGQDNERVLFKLDEMGILAAAGSACSASDEEPSHVLKALGLSDAEAQASLRFTMGRGTTQLQIEKTVAALKQITQ
ncbi:MAG TPA: cysteine desulfurase family protein [Candidatus Saccharimonadales bacterium]|nr:cysteine desulfurase family protein [Candidatus Saccharimonadales bacterium]